MNYARRTWVDDTPADATSAANFNEWDARIAAGFGRTFREEFTVDALATDWNITLNPDTVTVSSGRLTVGSSSQHTLFNRRAAYDSVQTCKFRTRAVATGVSVPGDLRLICRRTANTSYLFSRVAGTYAAPNLELWRQVAGVNTNLKLLTGAVALVQATDYWLRTLVRGDDFAAELWAVDPDAAAVNAVPLVTARYGLPDASGVSAANADFAAGDGGIAYGPTDATTEYVDSYRMAVL